MICVQHSCSECKHIRPNIDGWRCACDAFPNGIPDKYLFDIDVTALDECANGIKYEKKSTETPNQ